MRQIRIYSNTIKIIPEKIKKQLNNRNTNIEYIPISNSNEERIELYGYDKSLKYITNISRKTKLNNVLKTIINKIDKMPMGEIEKKIRERNNTRKHLLKKCGLPDVKETSHCFADSTHYTCCMLGSKAIEYADSSGNPIGSLSEKVQYNSKKDRIGKTKTKTKKNLTPWCTCTGSKVCSYYTSKFGSEDGTHIKFIGYLSNKNNKNHKNSKTNNSLDEEKAITKLNIFRHQTPGIMN